jgi:hypothetical protein
MHKCAYYDETTNTLSDEGVMSSINKTTGVARCFTTHLTDFSIVEIGAMKANYNRSNS